MRSATELRREVESALAGRIPSALSFRPHLAPELVSCGLVTVDAVLGGGLMIGAITELTGAHSSGRTTLALSALAQMTSQGESCAYVDVTDCLDPVSAAALGVDLQHLLWVRGAPPEAKDVPQPEHAASPRPETINTPPTRKSLGGAGWCHPRNEALGLSSAVSDLFASASTPRDFTPRCSEAVCRERVRPVLFAPLAPACSQPVPRAAKQRAQTSWTQLDRALRATDLLLNTGGFRAIVLDMGDVAPNQARAVPLPTWYRFRLQTEKSRTIFLLLTRIPCANSCAAVSLHCEQQAIDWQQAEANSPRLLSGLRYRLEVQRSRQLDQMRKKPVASVNWSSTTAWSR